MESSSVQFKNLVGFPQIDNKIETKAFLNAAKEIVSILETFGKLFTPVVSDMNGNITKLTKVYDRDHIKYEYLEDLIILNLNVEKNLAGDALLWLKRALQMILNFFENIFYDATRNEILKRHLQDAYERSLKPYHGFIIQNTFKLFYSWVPTRSQLIGEGVRHDENVDALALYLPCMRENLQRIDALLKKLQLDDSHKV